MVNPHPGVWLSTPWEMAVHCEGHYLKGPVMEHGCHTKTEGTSSDQVPSNAKGSHLVTQSQYSAELELCACPASQGLRNGSLGLRMKTGICLCSKQLGTCVTAHGM